MERWVIIHFIRALALHKKERILSRSHILSGPEHQLHIHDVLCHRVVLVLTFINF